MNVDDVTSRFLEVYKYLEEEGVVRSASQFSKVIQLSRSGFNEVEKGRSKIGMQPVLNLVQEFPVINRDWLFFGEGEMLNKPTPGQLLINEEGVLGRINEVIDHFLLTTDELTKTSKLSPLEIQSIIDGKKPFTLNFIFDFLECYPRLSSLWLLDGRGEMLRSYTKKEADEERIQELKYTIELQKELIEKFKAKANRSSGQGIERPHSSESKGHVVSGMEESNS